MARRFKLPVATYQATCHNLVRLVGFGRQMKRTKWQLQEAKSNLSQLIKQARDGEPQIVTVHGKPAAVVVSASEFTRITRRGKLSAALLRPDLAADDLDLRRSREPGRDVIL